MVHHEAHKQIRGLANTMVGIVKDVQQVGKLAGSDRVKETLSTFNTDLMKETAEFIEQMVSRSRFCVSLSPILSSQLTCRVEAISPMYAIFTKREIGDVTQRLDAFEKEFHPTHQDRGT
jgi:hypothetical protein